MKLLKRFFILLFSFSLIVTSGILISQFIPKQNRVSAASSYKYFYLSDMEPSSTANSSFILNKDYVTLKRGTGLVPETFVKNITFTANNTITYNLKGLNATRFSAIIGVENGSATFTVIGDGATLYNSVTEIGQSREQFSAITLDSASKYSFVDVDVTNVKNLVLQVSNSSSTRATFANPRLFGSNLLVGTEGTAIDLSYLPHDYKESLGNYDNVGLNFSAVDGSGFANGDSGIAIPVHNNSSSPAKIGWNIEGIGAYRFVSTLIATSGTITFQVRVRIGTGGDEIIYNQQITGTTEIDIEIPADATYIVLAGIGNSGEAQFINAKLYCSYVCLSDVTPTDNSVGWDELRFNSVAEGSATLKNSVNGVARASYFKKNLFAHAPSTVFYNLNSMGYLHLTRFTAFVGIVSTKQGGNGVNFVVKFHYTDGSSEEKRRIDGISCWSDLTYVDVLIPVGVTCISLIAEHIGDANSDHAIWCAPYLFGNKINLYNTAPSKLEHNETSHFREGTSYTENHNYSTSVEIPATCTTNGTTRYTCTVCDYSYTETIDKLEHSYGNWQHNDDNHYKICSVCSKVEYTQAHAFTNSCDTTCNVCNYTRTIQHSWENEYTADKFFHWYECSVCGEKKNEEVHLYDYNSDKECNTCGHVRTLEIKNSASLSLKGEISLNLYVDATKYTPDTEAYVKLTYNHNKTGYTPNVATDTIYLKTLEPEKDDGTYKFSVSFASGQIAENVKIELYDSQQVKCLELNYSVLTYCESVINNQSQQDNLKNLCKSLINYGIRSIENFNYSVSLAKDTNEYLQTIENAPEQAPTVNNEVKTGSIATLQHYKYSLVALSEISIRLYFKLDYGQNFYDYKITLTTQNGKETEMNFITGANDSGYYVEVFGIESANIDTTFTVNITYQTESLSITYSALDYISDKLAEQNLSSTTQNLCMAIYHYNYYANIYFNK